MFDKDYWDKKYLNDKPVWDVGYAVPAFTEYFAQVKNKESKILVPGAGNAYEVEYLFRQGFNNVFLLDFAPRPIQNFLERMPDFPKKQIIMEDFFEHRGEFDLIVEHTFLTSFTKEAWTNYAKKMHELLKPKGKFIGLLFNHEFDFDGPPYGGTPKEYQNLFSPYFDFKVFETAYNSIKPRKGREIFLNLVKKH